MRMNILHTVQSYPPAEGGMAEVARQLSERLAALGHRVTVATESRSDRAASRLNGVEIASFQVSGNAVTGLQGEVAAYRRFLLESRFDIVTNFAAQQWATDIALPLLPRIAGRKVFVPTGFSGLYSRRYRDYFRQMPGWMASYDMNVFLSDSYRDIVFAREHGIARTALIPNGAAADEFLAAPAGDLRARLGIAPDAFLILHVGSHSCFKGHLEALEIFDRARLANSTLLLVGNEPAGGCADSCRAAAAGLNASHSFRSIGASVVVGALSRPDTVAAYHAADLFLLPSNIECSPIVLFECMASRTPFLSTEVGNSAEIVAWSGAGALLPSAPPEFLPREGSLPSRLVEKLRLLLGRSQNFVAVRADIPKSAEMLLALRRDADERDRMARSGFSAWQERFTWEKIACDYEALYQRLLEGAL